MQHGRNIFLISSVIISFNLKALYLKEGGGRKKPNTKPKRCLGACKGMANVAEVGAQAHCSCFICAASGLGAIAIELYEPLKTPGQDGRETDVITDIITI